METYQVSESDQLSSVAREVINLPETEKGNESQLPEQVVKEVARFSCGFFKRLLEGSLRKDNKQHATKSKG